MGLGYDAHDVKGELIDGSFATCRSKHSASPSHALVGSSHKVNGESPSISSVKRLSPYFAQSTHAFTRIPTNKLAIHSELTDYSLTS